MERIILALFSFMFLFCGCDVAGKKVDGVSYIAHRGASFDAPENTMAAIELAWQRDADAVEIDVYLTLDKQIIATHDRNTSRFSPEKLEIAASSAARLRTLDVGSWKSPRFKGEKMPLIEEVFASMPKNKKLFIEIKCGKEIVPHLKQAIESSGKERQMVVICFNHDVLRECKKTMPDIPAYWLIGTQRDKQTDKQLDHNPAWLKMAQDHNIDGLSVHYAGVTADFMTAVKQSSQDLYVWTVNDPSEAVRLIDLGVKGITTDRPAWLKEQVKKANIEKQL